MLQRSEEAKAKGVAPKRFNNRGWTSANLEVASTLMARHRVLPSATKAVQLAVRPVCEEGVLLNVSKVD